MIGEIRKRFTMWYFNRGYGMEYGLGDDIIFTCPWWVKPLLIFFSQGIYVHATCMVATNVLRLAMLEGIEEAKRDD